MATLPSFSCMTYTWPSLLLEKYVPKEHRSQFAIDKHINDGILDIYLHVEEYFVENQLTITDLITFKWVYCALPSFNIDLKEFHNLHAWTQKLSKIRSIGKSLDVPFSYMFKNNK